MKMAQFEPKITKKFLGREHRTLAGPSPGVIMLFPITSIVATEKHPLARNCSVQTLPLTVHDGGEKLEK